MDRNHLRSDFQGPPGASGEPGPPGSPGKRVSLGLPPQMTKGEANPRSCTF